MKDIQGQARQRGYDQQRDSETIDVDATLTTISTSRISKSLQSKDGKIGRSTTVRSGAITRANKSSSANIHTFNFTGMNGATMVAPWSGSGPSVNSFISNLNAHGVFGIDAFYALPTHSDLIEWISDSNALIKEFDLWSMQNHINQSCRKTTPDYARQRLVPTIASKTLNGQYQNNKVKGQRCENAAARPKAINVVHEAILSQKSGATHV